jgi:hypothetical protein
MDTDHRRMTALELDKAAASLLPTTPPLPPMTVPDMLAYFTERTRELQADLWTFRDAIDAHLRDTRRDTAVAALAELAELFDDATNTVRTLASDLRIPLPAELFGPGC